MTKYPSVLLTFAAGIIFGLCSAWLYVGWSGDHVTTGMPPAVAKEGKRDDFDEQEDQLAMRKPNALLHLPWASRVDIQLGAHEDRLNHDENDVQQWALKTIELQKRMHDLELVDRCRKDKP